MFDLSGHVAIVTGGTSGVGLGYSRGLVKRGAKVAIWARDEARTAATVATLRELGGDVAGFKCDVSQQEQIDVCMEATLAHFGAVHSCFANAGVINDPTEFIDTSLADWRHVCSINLDGAFLTLKAAARHMIQRKGGGKLIVTSSVGSLLGSPLNSSYSATKGAVNALTRCLAVELGPHNIQVNAILPGWIESGQTQTHREYEAPTLARIPSTFLGTPEHVEGIAVLLASAQSDYITGQCIAVDGGYAIV